MEFGPAVERHKFQPIHLETSDHHLASWPRHVFPKMMHLLHSRIFKNGGVEIRRILSLSIEPDERSNFLHLIFLLNAVL